jgi:asparagine N-glycosylation enzyme membrane subunit Stt3
VRRTGARCRALARRYDAVVEDDQPANEPGERRLARPPSDRYSSTASEPGEGSSVGSPARGMLFGDLVAVMGAAAITLAGGLVTITAGLLVVAAVVGWAVAVAVAYGAGASLRGRARAWISVLTALISVGLGQVGLWLLARGEGGVLPLIDYLGETFGILVPLQLAIAGLVAWLRSR